ncbi:MAG TPA: hypothetical protein VMI31_04035, partial [Fimbriimonadaceae bacterium]|nr:hypothetical protein [Fimbriimonadaceae bacterium]
MRLTTFRPLVLVAVVAAASAAVADNAALTSGGQPEMLSSHRSVAMASEVVRLTVHWNRVDTDCSFLFVNHGKACKVNMGFPDFGLWGYDYPRKKPETMFRQYHSFVDGKPVKTKLVLGKGGREQWQTKTVSFSAGGKRIVREVYTTDIGGAAISKTEAWAFASYLLHTGASWNGNIGKATISVTFDPDSEVVPPLDMVYGSLEKAKLEDVSAHLKKPGGIIVAGPCKPTLH